MPQCRISDEWNSAYKSLKYYLVSGKVNKRNQQEE